MHDYVCGDFIRWSYINYDAVNNSKRLFELSWGWESVMYMASLNEVVHIDFVA